MTQDKGHDNTDQGNDNALDDNIDNGDVDVIAEAVNINDTDDDDEVDDDDDDNKNYNDDDNNNFRNNEKLFYISHLNIN